MERETELFSSQPLILGSDIEKYRIASSVLPSEAKKLA